jgi:predicted permease
MRQFLTVVRRLLRAPGFTAIALVTLAIGIGANTAVFTVLNSVLIKPLPYSAPEELVSIWFSAPGIELPVGSDLNCSPTIFETFREENRSFKEIGLWAQGGGTVEVGAESEGVATLVVTRGALETLGVRPVLGRWFSAEDDRSGSPRTVILDHGYWERRFGRDPAVIGQTLTFNEQPAEIIGVMPRGFRFLDYQVSLFVPQRFDPARLFLGNFSHRCVARLRPEVSLDQAEADVARMLPLWLRAWPPPPGLDAALFEGAQLGPALRSSKRDVVGDLGDVLWILMDTVGLVLVIACANVANLLLVRAEGRHQELAIRAALGAGWRRIAGELLTESVLLAVAGGVLGVGLAQLAVRGLVTIAPVGLPRLSEVAIDPAVLAFAAAVSVGSGIVFGLVPVARHAGPRLGLSLRGGGRTVSASRERHRARNTLVVVQVALALVLLVGSGLMIRTVQQLRAVDPGFTRPDQLQTIRLLVRESQAEEAEEVTRLLQTISEAVAGLPGVTGVVFTNSAPMEGFTSSDVLFAEDHVYAEREIPPIRRFGFVSPGLFQTLGTPLIVGRDFTWDDLYLRAEVAVVSQDMARELWGAPAAALGKRVRSTSADPWREVVGVVGDVRHAGVREPAPTTVYWPALMDRFWGNDTYVQRGVTLLIRSSRVGQPGFLDDVRAAIDAHGTFPLSLIRTVQDLYDLSLARTSFTLVILAISGAMALLLGIVGIYGVMSYSVTQRMREIGIRMALGARPGAVRGMFVRHGMTLAGLGVVVGLSVAIGVTRLMTALLFGISAVDPVTYGAVALVLAAAAALASYLPARRATAIDPISVLRAE